MNKQFILVLYGKTAPMQVTADADPVKIAGGADVEWTFVQGGRRVCKINIARPAVKLLYDRLQATGLYSDITLFEHVEW